MSYTFRNSFEGGIDSDTNPHITPPNRYPLSQNMELTGRGNFYSLKNIRSSEKLQTFFSTSGLSGYDILGAYEGNVRYFNTGTQGTIERTIIIFARNTTGIIRKEFIYFYREPTNDLYTYYEYTWSGIPAPESYLGFDNSESVDAVRYKDDNKELLYFVDNYNPLRKITLEFDFLLDDVGYQIDNVRELTVQPYGNQGSVTNLEVIDGNLLSGSYQFAYRYYDTKTGRVSKICSWSNPISVFPDGTVDGVVTNQQTIGGLPNIPSKKGVKVTMQAMPVGYRDIYDKVQVVVLKRIDGSKVAPTNAFILDPYGANIPNLSTLTFNYKGAENETEISIDELIIDDLPIKTAKTLEIKDNRLFLANVKLHDRVLEDVNVSFNNTGVIEQDLGRHEELISSVGGSYSENTLTDFQVYKNPENIYKYRGYFRDELYRFGVVAYDEFGNKSNVMPLQFTTLNTGNKSLSSDFKFPDRTEIPINKDIDNVSAIGLRLVDFDFDNLPDWAVGVEFVRTRRIKNILGQSAHVPCVMQQPSIDAIDGNDQVTCPTPVGSNRDGTYAPKNHLRGAALHIVKNFTCNSAAGVCTDPFFSEPDQVCMSPYDSSVDSTSNDARYFIPTSSYCYPPELMYNLDGVFYQDYTTLQGNSIRIVDAISFWLAGNPYIDNLVSESPDIRTYAGTDLHDQVSGCFRADSLESYYYRGDVSRPNLETLSSSESLTFNEWEDWMPSDGVSTIGDSLFFNIGDSAKSLVSAPLAYPLNPYNKVGAEVNSTLGVITLFGDQNGVASYNFSPFTIANTRAIVINTDKPMGDLSQICLSPIETEPTGALAKDQYAKKIVEFDNGTGTFTRNALLGTISENGDQTGIIYQQILDAVDEGKQPSIPAKGSSAGATVIYNIERGLDDFRYGDQDLPLEFISTGTYLQKGAGTTDVDIWGGDCFISKPYFKVNESTIIVQDNAPQVVTCAQPDRLATWAFKDYVDVISYYVESEINCDLAYTPFNYPIPINIGGNTVGLNINADTTRTLGSFKSDFTYQYHFGYSAQNDVEAFFSINTDNKVDRSEYTSSIVFSDINILNDSVDQFSRFRALARYDMPAEYGDITKLEKLSNDDLYVIQETGVSVLPVNQRVIEDAQGGELVINTDAVVTEPRYILTENGCQNIRTVSKSGNNIYFFDARRKEIIRVGSDNTNVSNIGFFEETKDVFINDSYEDKDVHAAYDFTNMRYILSVRQSSTGSDCIVFSEKVGAFESLWRISKPLSKYVSLGGNFYILGEDLDFLFLERMYSDGAHGTVLGESLTPSIDINVNPIPDEDKVLDLIKINSNSVPSSMFVETENNVQLAVVNEFNERESCYYANNIRDTLTSPQRRLVDRYFIVKLLFDNNDTLVSVDSIESKYRIAHRSFKGIKKSSNAR